MRVHQIQCLNPPGCSRNHAWYACRIMDVIMFDKIDQSQLRVAKSCITVSGRLTATAYLEEVFVDLSVRGASSARRPHGGLPPAVVFRPTRAAGVRGGCMWRACRKQWSGTIQGKPVGRVTNGGGSAARGQGGCGRRCRPPGGGGGLQKCGLGG